MIFNLNMFESEKKYAVVSSKGYESVLIHRHEFVELTYIESGTAVQKIGFETVNLKKGDLFVISDDSEHSIRPTCEENDFRVINIIFLRDFVDFDYSVFNPIIPFNVLHLKEITDLIAMAGAEYENRGAFSDEAVKGCIYIILSRLAKLYVNGAAKVSSNRNVAYVMSAVKFIKDNFNKKICLEDVASHVGLTSGYLQKIFNKERKTSVIEYLLRYRVEQSCKLLIETDKTIAQVSEAIGFSDIKNFHYAFKRVFGMTPNEYRMTHRNKLAYQTEVNDEIR